MLPLSMHVSWWLLIKAFLSNMDYPVDVGILASYFGFIALLLWRISPTLAQAFQHKQYAGTLIFGVGALLSLLATWTYMLKYFQHSYNEWQAETRESFSLNAVSHWLHSVSLFDDAWRTVSLGDWPWLFSHRLCLFTVGTWTPFLALEGMYMISLRIINSRLMWI